MDYFGLTDRGMMRGHNEDFLFLPDNTSVTGLPAHNTKKLGELFIVADGLGGYRAGEVASKLATQWFAMEWYSMNKMPRTPLEVMRINIDNINQRIRDYAYKNPEYYSMGTTFIAALVDGQNLHILSVGDSRIYECREEQIFQLSKDHSEVWELYEKGIISKDEMRSHPLNHLVTSAVGIDYKLSIFSQTTMLRRKATYLLCSDGLTDLLSDREIKTIVKHSSDLDMAASTLVQSANEAGGKDNITVVLFRADN